VVLVHGTAILLRQHTCIDDNEKTVFQEMQTFMYAVIQYEVTRDAQSICCELVKHALAQNQHGC
jgi:uncharacterized protein YhhL (DUF1145 family)